MIIKIKLLLCLFIFTGILQLHAQTIEVSGKVKNDVTSEPLAGATVSVKNGTFTLTDAEGNYSIKLPASGGVLIVTFSGMETLQQTVLQSGTLNFLMKNLKGDLGEVVVVGYGRQSRKFVSLAVATVSASTIAALPIYRVEQALQGTVPGITVAQNSGSPGSPLTVRLRGTSTAGNAQPLYLVDGMQVPDLNYLNAADIDNISILKDAASAAIYGARGGNGVVLVTTKSGRRNNKRPVLSLDLNDGIQNLAHKPDVMNKDQYIAYFNQFQDINGTPGKKITDAQKAKLPNTDWYESVFEKNAPMQNASLSIANGGEGYSYYLSGGIFNQDGLVGGNSGKSNYTRKNLKFKFEADVLPNVNLKAGVDIVRSERNFLYENQAGTGVALMNYLSSLPPIYPTFDHTDPTIPFNPGDVNNPVVVNGDTLPAVGAITNPFLALKLNNNRANSAITSYNIGGTWKLLKNIEINSSFMYYEDQTLSKSFVPSFDYRPKQYFFNDKASYSETNYKTIYNQWEANARYKVLNLSNQSLELLVGTSVLTSKGNAVITQGNDFLVNDFDKINFSLIRNANDIHFSTPYPAFETSLLSFFGRVNYVYKQKYLFTGSVRSDASSKFGPSKRTGIFPAFSAGWILSEESFLKNVRNLNLLKLRASWGINGNDNISNYQYSTVFDPSSGPSFGGQNTPGISVPFLANTSVKWEQVAQTDIGIDLNAFNNSLGISLDYYDKKTSDMLIPIGTPIYTGLGSAAANVADVSNKGLEFLVSYKKENITGFSWNTAFNIAYNKNEVTSLGSNGQPLSGGQIGFIFPSPITRTDIGHPIASFYGYKIDKIDANGNFIFKDLDGKPGLSEKDKTFIGNPFPDFTYGFNLGFSFKGFDLSGFLYGSHGNDIYDATVRLDATYSNRPVSYGKPGAPKNVLGTGGTGSNQTEVSDYYVKDGSFAKLKTLTLGYTLPDNLLRSIKLSKVRFYITGQNLFVITKYKGIDPEIGQAFSESVLDVGIDRGFYPQPRTVLFGLQARF
jgi:TonB-linked SusC/RagA family outer membrane protein